MSLAYQTPSLVSSVNVQGERDVGLFLEFCTSFPIALSSSRSQEDLLRNFGGLSHVSAACELREHAGGWTWWSLFGGDLVLLYLVSILYDQC